MTPATNAEILHAIELLSSLRKPKDAPGVMLEAYEIALKGVSALALQAATENALRSAKFMPSPSELRQAIQAIEQHGRRHEERANRLRWEEDEHQAKPMDKAAQERATALWQRIKPTLKAMPTEDEEPTQEPEPQLLTEAEQLERIRQIGMQPIQPTAALLRALAHPMNPEREG